jgi:hypothetical protein
MIPHFALPFRFVAGTAAVNDQDSTEDVAACAEAVLRYVKTAGPDGVRRGAAVELPDFGTPDQAFKQGGADPGEIAAALNEWEPRATEQLAASAIEDLVQTVRVQIGGQSGS